MKQTLKQIIQGIGTGLALTAAVAGCAGSNVEYSKPVPNMMYRLNDFFANASMRARIKQSGAKIVEGYRNGYIGEAGAGNDLETSALIEAGTQGYCITPIGDGNFKFKYLGSGTWVFEKDFERQINLSDLDNDKNITGKESKNRMKIVLAENQKRYPDCNSPKYLAYEREFNKEFDRKTQDMESRFNQRKKAMENSFRQRTQNYGGMR